MASMRICPRESWSVETQMHVLWHVQIFEWQLFPRECEFTFDLLCYSNLQPILPADQPKWVHMLASMCHQANDVASMLVDTMSFCFGPQNLGFSVEKQSVACQSLPWIRTRILLCQLLKLHGLFSVCILQYCSVEMWHLGLTILFNQLYILSIFKLLQCLKIQSNAMELIIRWTVWKHQETGDEG
jgi:hypothetical protein